MIPADPEAAVPGPERPVEMSSPSHQAARFDVGTLESHEDKDMGAKNDKVAMCDDDGNPDMGADGRRILAACLQGIDVTELYSPDRINKVCSEFGLNRGTWVDLRTGWDFNLEAHRRATWDRLRRDEPLFVIGGPPCTMFSQLQAMNTAVTGKCQG